MGTPKHYQMKISPAEYIAANNLDFFEGNVVKYISRHKEKDGAKDIRKIIDYCQMILKYDYNEEQKEEPQNTCPC